VIPCSGTAQQGVESPAGCQVLGGIEASSTGRHRQALEGILHGLLGKSPPQPLNESLDLEPCEWLRPTNGAVQ